MKSIDLKLNFTSNNNSVASIVRNPWECRGIGFPGQCRCLRDASLYLLDSCHAQAVLIPPSVGHFFCLRIVLLSCKVLSFWGVEKIQWQCHYYLMYCVKKLQREKCWGQREKEHSSNQNSSSEGATRYKGPLVANALGLNSSVSRVQGKIPDLRMQSNISLILVRHSKLCAARGLESCPTHDLSSEFPGHSSKNWDRFHQRYNPRPVLPKSTLATILVIPK